MANTIEIQKINIQLDAFLTVIIQESNHVFNPKTLLQAVLPELNLFSEPFNFF